MAFVMNSIITSMPMETSVRMGLSKTIITNVPTMLMTELMNCGMPWLSISRMASMSLV